MSSHFRNTLLGSAALIGLLGGSFVVPAIAAAETQEFSGSGAPFGADFRIAMSSAQAAGYTSSQCSLESYEDETVTIICTR
ncbi:MAG: hypothetical protein ACR2N4_03030 [Jatrophihabitans sp.]